MVTTTDYVPTTIAAPAEEQATPKGTLTVYANLTAAQAAALSERRS